MLKKSMVRGLVVLCLVCLASAPLSPLSADPGDQGSATGAEQASGFLQEVLEWLLNLVYEPADGDNGPTVDPAG